MLSLPDDLMTRKDSLQDFKKLTTRILEYLPDVVTNRREIRGYVILSSTIAGILKYARPVNEKLFCFDSAEFNDLFEHFMETLELLCKNRFIEPGPRKLEIDRAAYTIQQSIGIGLDFLGNPNSARKHVGNRFEELIRLFVSGVGVTNSKMVFKIPYPSSDGEKTYSCETDLVLSPYSAVKSNAKEIHRDEVIVSLKTSSKDRMGKIFLDKMLMERFAGHDVKVAGIFLNDVQRKGEKNISFTFVSGLFMVYTKFLTRLDGVYFIDRPPKALEPPYHEHIAQFSRFLSSDIWKLLT